MCFFFFPRCLHAMVSHGSLIPSTGSNRRGGPCKLTPRSRMPPCVPIRTARSSPRGVAGGVYATVARYRPVPSRTSVPCTRVTRRVVMIGDSTIPLVSVEPIGVRLVRTAYTIARIMCARRSVARVNGSTRRCGACHASAPCRGVRRTGIARYTCARTVIVRACRSSGVATVGPTSAGSRGARTEGRPVRRSTGARVFTATGWPSRAGIATRMRARIPPVSTPGDARITCNGCWVWPRSLNPDSLYCTYCRCSWCNERQSSCTTHKCVACKKNVYADKHTRLCGVCRCSVWKCPYVSLYENKCQMHVPRCMDCEEMAVVRNVYCKRHARCKMCGHKKRLKGGVDVRTTLEQGGDGALGVPTR